MPALFPARSRWAIAALAVCLLAVAGTRAHAQVEGVLRVAGAPASAGLPFSTTVRFDNLSRDVRGWSYGVCHDATLLSLTGVSSGATTGSIQLGGPPEFESIDLFAGGFTQAVVVCYSGCDTLPVGSDYELAVPSYDVLAVVPQATDLCFCGTLGSPQVEVIVVGVPATALALDTICGTIDIQAPPLPVAGLTCTPVPDPCACTMSFAWVNQGLYDAIEITRDGILLATLPGTDTSFSTIPPDGLPAEYCVTPIVGGAPGPAACCTSGCTVGGTTLPDPVESLICLVEPTTCTASLSWINGSDYSELIVQLDGVDVLSLPGTATSATVTLPGTGVYELCVIGTTLCGDPIPPTCCGADCERDFTRGDCDDDGAVNIVDPVFALEHLFGISTLPLPTCTDSCDANDDEVWDITDSIYLLEYLFQFGPYPPEPHLFPCGQDTTGEPGPGGGGQLIGCAEYIACP